jgi:hypothetical protein
MEMLKGKTTLKLNKATVIAALQMYLDATFKESHIVMDVANDPNSYDGPAFTVTLDDGAEEAKPE